LRVSSKAVMRAVVGCSGAFWWLARMRAVSSMAAAQECSALVTAAVSAGRAGGAVDLSVSRVTGR
jgi:hypothetical protein